MNDEETLEAQLKELEEYKRQKEVIRQIVGRIGAVPTAKEWIVNLLFVLLVLSTFALSLLSEGIFHTLALEIGILLISLKIAYFLYNESRINHFQFWILSSIEWQTNKLDRRFWRFERKLDTLLGIEEQNEGSSPDDG